ncbi:MAG TPA: polyphosphate kinase 1 [Pyrinomonadaceae bacterium]
MSTALREAEIRDFPRRVEETEQPKNQVFFNRELSLMAFHARVLEEALDARNPLLERLKFLAIFSANLDEFFMIRVSGLKEEVEQKITTLSVDGLNPAQQLEKLRERILPLVEQQSKCLMDDILPKLRQEGLEVANYDSLTRYEKQDLEEYFTEKVFPILTPLGVDPSHPFPYISPLSVNIGLMVAAPGKAIGLGSKHPEPRFVRIKVPSVLPRLVSVGMSGSKYVLLEDVIEANIQTLFPGMEPGPCYRFRVTRDADIEIREEEAEDLLRIIEEEVRQRRFGDPVRLEVSEQMPDEMIEYLTESLDLNAADVYKIQGPLATQELMSLFDWQRPDLKDIPFEANVPEWCANPKQIFDAIREKDRLVHHPYDSYNCVTDFINQAVDDEDVVAIKICLYRTGPDSPIPPALIRASEQGKQVTALIELKARFDEEHNIEWARKLDEAGVHVVYGVYGLKTHGKLTLVVRQEDDKLKRYVHIASGNYNPTTSCTYTDLGLFTCNDEIGRDATELFNYLTGFSQQLSYRKLMVAPVSLRERLNELFDREIEHQREGRPARIIAKFNRLADQQIIEKLYEVGRAGVQIDLVVRGICMLRPGVPGLSENIRVRSIVGRFLEHSRVFYFANGGDEELFIGSADWMARNLKHRIEVVTPVYDADAKTYLKDILLGAYLRDNIRARELQSDGTYRPVQESAEEVFDSQVYFIGRSPGNF